MSEKNETAPIRRQMSPQALETLWIVPADLSA